MRNTQRPLLCLAVVFACTSARADSCQLASTTGGGGAADLFGSSVAFGGSLFAGGAPGRDVGGLADAGTVYLYSWSGGSAALEAMLTATDKATGDEFGFAVGCDGIRVLVGAKGDDDNGNQSGSAYLFHEVEGSGWQQEEKLTANDGAAGDLFGFAVDIDGDFAVVGAPGDVSGAAYVFERNGSTWSQVAKLVRSNQDDDFFGWAVAISGNRLIVGAPALNASTGAAYVFERVNGVWSEDSRLLPANSASADYVGLAVDVEGTTAIVGVPQRNSRGAAALYEKSGGAWVETQVLFDEVGSTGDLFGSSVSLSAGARATVGASSAGDFGKCLVFGSPEGGAWVEIAALEPNNGATGDHFGYSAAVINDVTIVGSPYHTVGQNAYAGEVYVFDVDTGCP